MSTAPVAATEPRVAPPRRGRVPAVLGLTQLMVVLDTTTIMNIALPSAQADLCCCVACARAHARTPPTPPSVRSAV
ncbi:hypothetical protein ACWDZ6_21165 [Streptomyces sp. NPDC002926]